MPQVRVVTDSLADIPPAISQALDITTVPAIVRFGETQYRDRIDLFPDEFYRKLTSSAELPKTSQPSPGTFQEIYETIAKSTDQILAIHTLSSLSGIYNSSVAAAHSVQGAQIEVIDSGQVSMSLGWLVILAARSAQQGQPLDQIERLVRDTMSRVHLVAVLDTLEYAQRGGRLGKGAALLGTVMNVKPFLSIVNGEVVPVEKVRTARRALERLVDMVEESGQIEELSLVHAAAPAAAQVLRGMLADIYPVDHIVMAEAGPVMGTHVGPGTVGVAWVNAPAQPH